VEVSDRLNLWPEKDTPMRWATVNLFEHKSMAAAIRAFANGGQVLKVFGPEDAIRKCYRTWKRLEKSECGEVCVSPLSAVSFYVQPPELKKDGTRKCISWEPK
jgi:hypothetical protein